MAARAFLATVVLTCAGCGASEEPGAASPDAASDALADSGDDGFEPFFDGQTLAGFEFVGITPADVSIEAGVLRCTCQPNGYLHKNESFRNFVLELGFRFERPVELAPGADATFNGNSGYFVYLAPPHQIWPSCLEVQGSYQETGDVFGLPGLTPGNDSPDLAALQTARKPVGEWNALRITAVEGALTIELNGNVVNTSAPGGLREGLIALESEGAEIHWRDVRIKRLP